MRKVFRTREISKQPRRADRAAFTGSLEQIASDVEATAAIGADEIIFGMFLSPEEETVAGLIRHMDVFYKMVR